MRYSAAILFVACNAGFCRQVLGGFQDAQPIRLTRSFAPLPANGDPKLHEAKKDGGFNEIPLL